MSEPSSLPNRRDLLAASTASAAAGWLNVLPVGAAKAAEGDAIRPFRVNIPEEELVDLRGRIAATRWPDRETVNDQSQGIRLAKLQESVRFWETDYDWRKAETKLNALPQFTTTIDDVDIHFIHVRWRHVSAMPLIITHGWPASVLEQIKLIGPLTEPTAHGGKAKDAFEVVIPSMPGTVPADVSKALQVGDPPPSGLSAEERRAYEQLEKAVKQVTYARLTGTRPQTLYGIADSPVDLAAWLLDHNDGDGQPAAAVYSALNRTTSATGEVTRDEILDNITLYWLTNTSVSAPRLYWENKLSYFDAKGVSIPVAMSVIPGEQYQAPRSSTERAYPKLIYYNRAEKGGHFAAWEQPTIFAQELRAAFRSLRGARGRGRIPSPPPPSAPLEFHRCVGSVSSPLHRRGE
ncbi:epoxide hydrolase N-terminal domain-containing protein [Limobrevibacterium gyesilva]|uniref:Epoxide hydrolase N-terminal domain-containing protein n=1 Tax=Limobrevibacterium gyesilva TaxID=2991712 RepID=A0AA41YNQ5_9PROT|nr:epoxide hydrolase N-terminal domain-containing protein [Limobrevibacterium gyesilva]MCW3477284.1 epoxide hydrolase N-terminal domain-containing protein [Limobrevibacterium gyesilva]